MSVSAAGAALGVVAGVGCCLVLDRLRLFRRPTLAQRVAPYLRDISDSARLDAPALDGRRASGPTSVLRHLLVRTAARLDAIAGGGASIRRRVAQLGAGSLEQIRLEQVAWGAAAMVATLALGLLRSASGEPVSPAVLLLLTASAGLGGVMARDRELSRTVARRRRRLLAELPTVAELLALSVAAGEGVAGAIERVSRTCRGDLGAELGRCLTAVRAGSPMTHALDDMADRLDLVPVRRFVEGMVVALERGTPLAAVLRAQAMDAREVARRELVETAARKEVAMMLPVVFLVLPTSVVFALFPGFYGLSLTS